MKNAILISWVFSLMFVGTVSATIIDVPFDQPTIQAGIDASSHGDTVRVESDTYVENIDFSGKNIVVGSWFLDAGDTSYISSTIIDGNEQGSVVTFLNGEDNTAVITGFTIQNGIAQDGGGIFCFNSDPTISNNHISGNSADSSGGGIACNNSSPEITNNTISGNTATGYDIGGGGGIYCFDNSSPEITNNTINGNSADNGGGISCSYSSPAIANNTISGNSGSGHGGGGICCYYSSPTINYNTISGNTAGWGGGILCSWSSSTTIGNNTISGNSAQYDGGGIECWYSSATISDNTISGNSAHQGGGIYCSYSSPTISNNTISGNSAGGNGGGIGCHNYSSPTISNNTISGNSAGWGGGIYCANSSPVITNTIFWGDSAPTGPEIYLVGGAPVITYCDVQGGWEGEGNIADDPWFCDPAADNYWLAENSPCVGAGQNGEDIGAFGIGCDEHVNIYTDNHNLPDEFYLSINYPNPFNASTTINYTLAYSTEVILDIYDILGCKVETLVNKRLPAGYHQAIWQADDFSSGVYFYKLQAGGYIETKKMALLK